MKPFEPIQVPQPLKTAEGFEPTKLFNVVDRLRAWSELAVESGPLMQVREDVVYLLDHHLRLYKRHEETERKLWYRVGREWSSEDMTWQERAGQLEARLIEAETKLIAAESMIAMAEAHFDKTSPIVTLNPAYRAAKETLES